MKICPDLTTISWEKAMLRGHGDFQRVNMHECIGETCAAYSDGICKKYDTEVKEQNINLEELLIEHD